MQLDTKDGIRCDGCGLVCKDDFIYYSFDIKKAKTKYSQSLPISQLNLEAVDQTLDYCAKCTEKIQDKVVESNKNNSGRKTGLRYCDFTGIDLMKEDIYYYISITKASVRHSGVPFKCDKCNTPTNKPEVACKCGHTHFSKTAIVDTDPRILELFVAKQVSEDFEKRKKSIKEESGAWDVRS